MKKLLVGILLSLFCAAPLYAMEKRASAPGDTSLILHDLAGQTVDIAAFTQQSKKPLLLFFWTSWCPYCMKEMSTINLRKQGLKDRVDLFAVNAGESKGLVERVAKRYNLEVRVFLDEQTQAVEAYGIVGVPAFVLINSQGKVVFSDNFFPDAEIRALQNK